jgi:hypothetical protein
MGTDPESRWYFQEYVPEKRLLHRVGGDSEGSGRGGCWDYSVIITTFLFGALFSLRCSISNL